MRNRIALTAFLLAGLPVAAQSGVQPPSGAPHPEVIYPDNDIPLPGDFKITREIAQGTGATPRTSPDPDPIDLPRDLAGRLSACWTPPPLAAGDTGQVTLRLSFTAAGTVIGTPATPYLQAGNDDERRALRASILDAIRLCTPLRFTPSLGKAIAGRVFAIRYVVRASSRTKQP